MKRAELVTSLELVGCALADNDMVPIFTCFCFYGNQVLAYNDSVAVITECSDSGTFAVNGATLLGLLRNSYAEDVTTHLEGQEAVIKTGRSTFKLPYFPQENFLFERPKGPWVVTLAAGQMIEGMKACLLTSSKDNSQPALMGICVSQKQKYVTLYSCDGDAVSRYTTAVKSKPNGQDYLLSNAFCEALIKIVEDTKAEAVQLMLNDEWAEAVLNTPYAVYGRMIEVENPLDHEALIKKTLKSAYKFVHVPTSLGPALARARVVADLETAKTTLTVKAYKLVLITETHMGAIRDVISLEGHSDVEAHASAALMQRSIGLCGEMAIMENCCAFRAKNGLFVLTSNM